MALPPGTGLPVGTMGYARHVRSSQVSEPARRDSCDGNRVRDPAGSGEDDGVSRAYGDEPQILETSPSLDRACAYLDCQLAADTAAWAPPYLEAMGARASQAGPHAVTRDAPPGRQDALRQLVALRSWRLRCGHCGAEWVATPRDVRASDAWLTCPQCRGSDVDAATADGEVRVGQGEAPRASPSMTVRWRAWQRDR